MSFLSSIFAGPGQGYAEGQMGQQQGVASDYNNLFNQLYPTISSDLSTAQGLEQPRQQDIANTLMNLSPGNQQALNQAEANNNFSNAQRAASQSAQQDAAAGLSPAYSAGNTTAANNQAATQSNNYVNYTLSPEYQAQQAGARLNLYGQAMNDPLSQDLGSYASGVYGAPHITPQPGILSSLAGPIGDYLTGGMSGLPSAGAATGLGAIDNSLGALA